METRHVTGEEPVWIDSGGLRRDQFKYCDTSLTKRCVSVDQLSGLGSRHDGSQRISQPSSAMSSKNNATKDVQKKGPENHIPERKQY